DTLSYELSYSADGGKTWKPVGAASGQADSGTSSRPTRASAEAALQEYKAQLDKDAGLTAQQRQENYDKAKALVEQYLKENPAEKEPAAATPKPAATPAATSTAGVTRQATYSWDTRGVPDGIYLLRIVASDKPSNPGEPLSDVKVTEP